MKKIKLSRSTISRFPVYLKALKIIDAQGVKSVMSKELSEYVAIQPTTIRRDFSMIGSLGKQGYGYDVKHLIKVFQKKTRFDDKRILLIGRIDETIARVYCTQQIDSIFDGVEMGPMDIAILNIEEEVQETVNVLADMEIKMIIDMTGQHFAVPKGVCVRTIDIVASIQELMIETGK